MLEFIKSKDYRNFIKDKGIVVSDWDMATIIINNRDFPFMYRKEKLLEIADKTADDKLRKEIFKYIEEKEFALKKIISSEHFYVLKMKECGCYREQGMYLKFDNAYSAGIKEKKPFYIVKRAFCECAADNPEPSVLGIDFGTYLGTANYNEKGELISCSYDGDKSIFGRQYCSNVDYRYIDLPYMFKFGDIVRVVGTEKIGIVGAFKDESEEKAYAEKMKKCGDYSDYQLYVDLIFDGDTPCSAFNHDHIAPTELEYANLDDKDIRKGHIEYIASQMKTKSLWSGKIRNPERIPYVIKELEETWKKYPDLRLGQLLICCGGNNLFNIEDDNIVSNLWEFKDK